MKILLFTILSLANITTFCHKDFEFMSATSEKWAGGRIESGHGTNYKITIIPNKGADKMKFLKMWVGDNQLDVKLYQDDLRVKLGNFKKKKELIISARSQIISDNGNRRNNRNQNSEISDKIQVKVPYEYKGEALLVYSVNGKIKYYEIEKFSVLKPAYHP